MSVQAVGVGVGANVGVGVGVGTGVGVGVGVNVGVRVGVEVGTGVDVAVGTTVETDVAGIAMGVDAGASTTAVVGEGSSLPPPQAPVNATAALKSNVANSSLPTRPCSHSLISGPPYAKSKKGI